MRGKIFWLGAVFGLGLIFFSAGIDLPPARCLPLFKARAAFAQDNWKEEFDDICSRTEDATALDAGELSALIGRCGKLAPRIDKLGESGRKVYMKRLSMCRALFVFVLEQKKAKAAKQEKIK